MGYVVIATQRPGVVESGITRHYWILCFAEDFRHRLAPLLPRNAQTLPAAAIVWEKTEGAMLMAAQNNTSSAVLQYHAVEVDALEGFFATFALAEVE